MISIFFFDKKINLKKERARWNAQLPQKIFLFKKIYQKGYFKALP